jgi:hypothetical protein
MAKPVQRKIRLSNTAARFEAVHRYLKGRVFHVTRLSNLPLIQECGEIRPNNDESFQTTFGMTDVSFFRKRGCVCLFDYQNATPEQIEDSIWKCSPVQALTPQSGIAIFMISANKCPKLLSWEQWKHQKAWGEMVVPHVEAGHYGPIPLALIDEIICVERDEDDPNSFIYQLKQISG